MIKKRLFSALMMGVLVVSAITFTACSDEDLEDTEVEETQEESDDGTMGTSPDNPIVFSEDMIDEDYDGEWYDTEAGYEVCLPADWEETEATDDQAGKGITLFFADPETRHNYGATLEEAPGDYTPEERLEAFGQEYGKAFYASFNGTEGIGFQNTQTGQYGFNVMIDGKYISGVYTPDSDEDYEDYRDEANNILCSVTFTE